MKIVILRIATLESEPVFLYLYDSMDVGSVQCGTTPRGAFLGWRDHEALRQQAACQLSLGWLPSPTAGDTGRPASRAEARRRAARE
jgi:hypothetical protein